MTVPIGALVRDLTLPELGYGRVVATREAGRVALVFQADPTPREVRLDDQRDVVRARLHPGQRVEVLGAPGEAARQARVVRVQAGEPGERYTYLIREGDDERSADEERLVPLGAGSDDPRELLEALDWRGPQAFHARAALRRTVALWHEDSFGIPALLGARIEPMPHQLHAARRVLTDRTPRFVLADEVGLGKTIEAGLVIQALIAADPDLRVLVVAPGAMTRQWLCELFLRFGEQVFVHVDAARIEDADAAALLAEPRLIVSTTALEAAPAAGARLLEGRRDLLVVDEAHQVPPGTPLYELLRGLARQASGVLALSATPSRRDEEGLLGLLALVSPDVWDPARPEALRERLAAQERVTARLATTLEALDRSRAAGTPLSPAELTGLGAEWAALLPEDEVVRGLAARLAARDAGAAEELAAYVQEFHRVDRRLIRTRRATVQALGRALCERRLQPLDYEVTKPEQRLLAHFEALPGGDDLDPQQRGLRGLYLRAACTTPLALLELLEERRGALEGKARAKVAFDPLAALGGDPGPAEEERLRARLLAGTRPLPGEAAWLKEAVARTHAWMTASPRGCARVQAALRWIVEHVGGGRKVLVFAHDRRVVEDVAAALQDALGPDGAAAIHHALDEARLSEVALAFQQPGGLQVLVSDELGGEGRNFQVASALVHLDQPWAVARLEQRIGRLDRVGRDPTRPVRSVVLRGPAPWEQALLRLHAEVFQVYERSLGGLEFALPRLQRRVTEAAWRGTAALDALRGPLAEEVGRERARLEEAQERALDSSRRALEEAAEQAEVLAERDGAADVDALSGWARRIGIEIRALTEETHGIRWSWERLRRVPPGLAPAGREPTEGRARKRGTFSRAAALADESLEFFGPGHPVIDALVRDLDATAEGRATVCLRDLGPERKGRLHLLVLARTELDRSAWEGTPVPAGLVHRAHARLWPQLRPIAVELRPAATPPVRLLEDRQLLLRLQGEGGAPPARVIDRDQLAASVELTSLWRTVRAGTEAALDALRAARRAEVDEAAQALADELAPDLGYLRGLIARDPAARARAEQELRLRELLLASVRQEQVLLEALALVIGA